MSDAIDVFHVKGADGVIRSLDEHYDCQKAVEQDPYGAWLAIQNQAYRTKELEAENTRLWDALEAYASKLEEHEIECPVLSGNTKKENLKNDD